MRKRNLLSCRKSAIDVNAEATEQREQNEGSESHLKTKRFGWISGHGSTFSFAIERLAG